MVATKSVLTICSESKGRYREEDLECISEQVRNAAQKIIAAKKSTYYGIGMAMVRITRAIFGNENSVLTVSTLLNGYYGESDVYVGIPSIVCRSGVRHILSLSLTENEVEKFKYSCGILRDSYQGLKLS